MSATPNSRRRCRRLAAGLLAAGLLALAGGCTFLADEFTWLDRPGPSAAKAPDAAVAGDDHRP